MPYCSCHNQAYRRNMDEGYRKKLRDAWATRDEKLAALLDYSKRSGIFIGDLEVYKWDHDDYLAKEHPRVSEQFVWKLANGLTVTLNMDFRGEEKVNIRYIIGEMGRSHICGPFEPLQRLIMKKYFHLGLFAVGQLDGELCWSLIPQNPFDIDRVTQIVLLETLNVVPGDPSRLDWSVG